MVQARDDQQPVQHAIGEQAQGAGGDHGAAEAVDSAVQIGPAGAENEGQDQARQAAGDRHKAAPAEKGQVVRQLDGSEAVVEVSADQAGENADRHPQLEQGRGPEIGGGQILGLTGQARDHFGRDGDQGLGAIGGHQETDHARQARRAIAVFGEAHRDADGEQQPQIMEDRVSRGGDKRLAAEDVRLAQPQQEPRDRQHGDGQHQGAAQGLQGADSRICAHGGHPACP